MGANDQAIKSYMFGLDREAIREVTGQEGSIMTEDKLPHDGGHGFEDLKKAIPKAVTSCEQSGNDPAHHFAGARKQIVKENM